MRTEETEVSPELRQVLCACYKCWQNDSQPIHKRTICYSWVVGSYEQRFGTTFHHSKLRQLAELGFLAQDIVVRGGRRRYYQIIDPDRVADLLAKWDLT